eukprot:218258-Hanusia_phi.AAC.2
MQTLPENEDSKAGTTQCNSANVEMPAKDNCAVDYELASLPDAPTFFPTIEEFRDPMRYIESIRLQAEEAGLIKIIPPKEWKCPFTIKEKGDAFHFQTCVQSIDQLRHRQGPSSNFLRKLRHFHKKRDLSVPAEIPFIDGRQVDLHLLYKTVEERGGVGKVDQEKKWNEVAASLKIGKNSQSGPIAQRVRDVYRLYLEKYALAISQGLKPEEELKEEPLFTVRKRFARMAAAAGNAGEEGEEGEAGDSFGFGEGGFYTFHSFRRRADDFKSKWFSDWERPVTVEDVEKEYWRVVDGGDLMLRVEYGNDLDVSGHGSGFPTATNCKPEDKVRSAEIAEASLLKYISPNGEISGVSAPWVYVGMLFSTFCWHNEDNYLYSINYMHHGAGKTWYGVPGGEAEKFEQVFQSEVPELFEKDPKLLFKLCTMVSPKVFQEKGVRVYHTVQRPGEFIVTMPQSYHGGFSHGFNCNEAVNFAPADWLPFGRASVERYKGKKRSPVFSHERLVMTLAHRNFSDATHARASEWIESEMLYIARKELEERKFLCPGDCDLSTPDSKRPKCFKIPRDMSNVVNSKDEWIGGVSEAEMPQCHCCLHYLYLSGAMDRRNPKKVSCLSKMCLAKLLGEEKDALNLASHSEHLILAYRFTLEELFSVSSLSDAKMIFEARKLDHYFTMLKNESDAAALTVWFLPHGVDDGKESPRSSIAEIETKPKNLSLMNGNMKTSPVKNPTVAGIKRENGAPAPVVPGKFYFGFCEEVINVLKKLAGQEAKPNNGGRGLCKIEWDDSSGLPLLPIQVGHGCVIECLGEIQVVSLLLVLARLMPPMTCSPQARPSWQDPEGLFYWPKGFGSLATSSHCPTDRVAQSPRGTSPR